MAQPSSRPRLTSVQARTDRNELLDSEKDQLSLDAQKCIDAMSAHAGDDGSRILSSQNKQRAQTAYVAAALALLLGFYRKKNGKQNPTDAGRAFGVEVSRPGAIIEWIARLEQLERALRARAKKPSTAEEETKLQAEMEEWCDLAILCIDGLHGVFLDYLKERAPSLIQAAIDKWYCSAYQKGAEGETVQQEKRIKQCMAIINELPLSQLRSRHEADFHESNRRFGMAEEDYPFTTAFLRSLLPRAKETFKGDMMEGRCFGSNGHQWVQPADAPVWLRTIEGARQVYKRKYGSDPFDDTSNGASSSTDVGEASGSTCEAPAEKDTEGITEEASVVEGDEFDGDDFE